MRALAPRIVGLVAMCLVSSSAFAASGEDARIAAARAAIERILHDESDVADELDRADAEVRAARLAADTAASASKAAGEALAARAAEERRAQDAWSRTWERLSLRLRARQRMLRAGQGGAALLADSPAAFGRRSRALDRILSADVVAIESARAAAREAIRAREEREEASAHATRAAEEAAARLLQAEEFAKGREALLASLRSERGLHERTIVSIERAQARLAEEVERLAAERSRDASGFPSLRGSLPQPVEGAVVEVLFGKTLNARFHTEVHQNGLDLRAPKGAAVRAVAPGRVAFAAPFRAYGNLAIVDHGGGYHTLYAHLDSFDVEEGDEVEAGARLGRVGDSGSLKGAYLYFEIRDGAKPIDPLPWLRTR